VGTSSKFLTDCTSANESIGSKLIFVQGFIKLSSIEVFALIAVCSLLLQLSVMKVW